jgi:hypothetical protein
LEENINIRASDYRFSDKKKYYTGFINDNGQKKEGTVISELRGMASTIDDFTENDIIKRTEDIVDEFIVYLRKTDLIRNEL